MREPVDHILRPQLPWRSDGGITECGLNAASVKTLTRADFLTRLNDYGKQRTAMLTCMTCSDTCHRFGTWEDDPRRALHREIEWETRGGHYWSRDERGVRLRDELNSIALLIDAHREEFDGHIVLAEQRRDWNAQKAALKPKPQPRIIGEL
jgi:hypothetical protein